MGELPAMTRPPTCDDDSDAWEAVGRHLLAGALVETQADLTDAVGTLVDQSRDGAPMTAEELRAARSAVNQLQRLLEENVAPVVDGAEPWERPPEATYGVLREWANCGSPEADD